MKVVMTGGGTGGHFYPLIAVAEELNIIIDEQNIADNDIYFFNNVPYDEKSLYETGIIFKQINAARLPNSLNPKNIINAVTIVAGIIQAFFNLFAVFPDVVFSKGGFAAFPTVFAARLLRIPVIVHESDSVPGRVNIWTAKFARNVIVSYKQAAEFFPKEKVIYGGQPIRRDLHHPIADGAHQFLGLELDVPVIWVLGGSSGAQIINMVLEEALPQLLDKYQIIHQTGVDNFQSIKEITDATLFDNPFKKRYHPFPFLNQLSMKMVAGIADIVVSRAGSTLFEIAHWEIPSIIIPITNSHGNHQIENAYNYAREGACVVIEENNLSDSLLVFEINRIFDDKKIQQEMKAGAQSFAVEGSAEKIAQEIAGIALQHEK